MNKKLLLCPAALCLAAASAGAEVLDWSKIRFWTGEGENRAALVVSLIPESGQADPGTLVWGFRWNEGTPSGLDMLREIAAGNKDMLALVQFTGDMGYTLNGIGVAPDVNLILSSLSYDFDSAKGDSRISFGFLTPEKSMGQTSAPGEETPELIGRAIADAADNHIIEHPLDAGSFGYPAYDYDWWILQRDDIQENAAYTYWNSGWYDGYWSYWTGSSDIDDLAYSGLGMSSQQLVDGDVHGWRFTSCDVDSQDEWPLLNYDHFSNLSTTVDIVSDDDSSAIRYYHLDGTPASDPKSAPGIYIRRQGSRTTKILIK